MPSQIAVTSIHDLLLSLSKRSVHFSGVPFHPMRSATQRRAHVPPVSDTHTTQPTRVTAWHKLCDHGEQCTCKMSFAARGYM